MAIPLILQGIPRLLPLLAGSMYSASETDPQAIEFLMKKITGNKDKKKEVTEAPTPDPEQDPQIPPSGIEEALKLIEKNQEQKKNQLTLPKGSMNDFFETSNEFESIEGRIEDVESRYYGGVGDLGDNQAAKTIQKIDGYDDYAIYIQEQAENFLGPEFKGFRITNTKEIMQLLNKQNKNKIKSFTLSPKQAVKFGYMANEAFMDPITTEPRGDLLIIESPIKSKSLVMRGRPEESEVISDTSKTSIKQSRIYNPYTGEVVYEPTEGPLVDTEPHNFETLIKTETKKSSFLDDLKERFTNKN